MTLEMPNSLVDKAAWGNFHPAPPMRGGGIRKFPARELNIKSEPFPGYPSVTTHTATTRRGRPIGTLQLKDRTIKWARVEEGFRRRGVSSHLLRAAEKKGPVYHDINRSTEGNAWAHAVSRQRGTQPPKTGVEDVIRSFGHSRKKTARRLRSANLNYDTNRRNTVTVTASMNRTGATTKGPLQSNSSRALHLSNSSRTMNRRRRVQKSREDAMDFLEMPGAFPQEKTRSESLTTIRTRDLKTGRFVGAPSLVAKNVVPALEAMSWGVPVGWLGIDRRKRKKKAKMDPKLSVTLKKKETS